MCFWWSINFETWKNSQVNLSSELHLRSFKGLSTDLGGGGDPFQDEDGSKGKFLLEDEFNLWATFMETNAQENAYTVSKSVFQSLKDSQTLSLKAN